jgi:hypothetical protein
MCRLDRLKEQNPELNISLIDMFAKLDPTDSYKYLEFIIKHLKTYYIDDIASDIALNMGIHLFGSKHIETLNEFEKHSQANRIENKDISSYKDIDYMAIQVKKAEEIAKQKELEKQVVKLYSDDKYLVIIPLTKESNKMYGANTKWCTTMETGGYWEKYFKSHKVIIFIDKVRNKKFALSKEEETNKIQVWNEMDNEVSVFECNLPSNVYEVIRNSFEKVETTEDVYYQRYPEENKNWYSTEKSIHEDYRTYYSIEEYNEMLNDNRVVYDITPTNDYMDIIRRVMNGSYGINGEMDTSSVTDTFQRLMGGERRR